MDHLPVASTGTVEGLETVPYVCEKPYDGGPFVGSGISAVMTSWIYGSPVSEIKPIWVCAFGTSHIGYRI